MELKKIKALLSDYYEGKTSREDELKLMNFFRHSEVPLEMEDDRLLFISMFEASSEEIPDKHFDEKLIAAIEQHDQGKRPARIKKIIYTMSGIAAGLLVIFGSYFLLVEQVNDIAYDDGEYTIEETMLAYKEAKNALMLVSMVMNTGTEQLQTLSKITEATQDLAIINKLHQGASELQILSKFDETTDKIMTNH